MLKISKWPSLRLLALKNEILCGFEFLIVWKKLLGSKTLLFSNTFHRYLLNFLKIQTDVSTYSLMPAVSNLAIVVFRYALFISGIPLVIAHEI